MFVFGPGNLGEEGEEYEYGLFAKRENSHFSISTRLDDKPFADLKNLIVQFDVRKEEKDTESEATIKIFGEVGHANVLYHIHEEL